VRVTGERRSIVGGTAWERTAWHATQRAAWEASSSAMDAALQLSQYAGHVERWRETPRSLDARGEAGAGRSDYRIAVLDQRGQLLRVAVVCWTPPPAVLHQVPMRWRNQKRTILHAGAHRRGRYRNAAPTLLRDRKACAHHAGSAHAVDRFRHHPAKRVHSVPNLLIVSPSHGSSPALLRVRAERSSSQLARLTLPWPQSRPSAWRGTIHLKVTETFQEPEKDFLGRACALTPGGTRVATHRD